MERSKKRMPPAERREEDITRRIGSSGLSRKAADVDLVSHPEVVVRSCQPRDKLDAKKRKPSKRTCGANRLGSRQLAGEADRIVTNLRQRIFQAARANDHRRVRSLQKLMLRSRSNILMSVRRVTQVNAGKNTPGVDKVLVKTRQPREEIGGPSGHLPATWLSQTGALGCTFQKKVRTAAKRRPIGIPTIMIRCLQAMVKNCSASQPGSPDSRALSYGFRPGRNAHDAIEKIYGFSCPNRRKKVVVDADITGAFDNICQEFILKALGDVPGKAAHQAVAQGRLSGGWEVS